MSILPRPIPGAAPPPRRSAHRIYIHVAWCTLGRLPLMSTGLRGAVELQLIGLCRRLNVQPLAVRATADRVRLVLRLQPAHSVTLLVERLKTGSEEALTDAGRGVHWNSGFAAMTVGPDEVRQAIRRVRRLD